MFSINELLRVIIDWDSATEDEWMNFLVYTW